MATIGALAHAPWHSTTSTPNMKSGDNSPTRQQQDSSTARKIMSEPRNMHGVVLQTFTLYFPRYRLEILFI